MTPDIIDFDALQEDCDEAFQAYRNKLDKMSKDPNCALVIPPLSKTEH